MWSLKCCTAQMNATTQIFDAALAAVDPYLAVCKALRMEGALLCLGQQRYDLRHYQNIIVVGAGKATARMALAVESVLVDRITMGLIVVKHGHSEALVRIAQVEAAHPIPSAEGVAATQRILQMVSAADERTLLITLLSGGASALLVAPAAGITLQDKQNTTQLLLDAGADICELNAVRKHLSAVKGGRLARACYPATMLTLILSDVIGDPLAVIASGPTVPDDSTYHDAIAVLARYGLQQQAPLSVMAYLQAGCAGKNAESVKRGAPCWAKTQNVLVANLYLALQAAQAQAQQLGYNSRIVTATLHGVAREAAQQMAQLARAELAQMRAGERRCLLSGGETTVTVRGKGQGGRNQEFALAYAIAIAGTQGISLLSVATDGSDGPNDAAGAMVNGATVTSAPHLDAQQYLIDNDSYRYFQKLDELTGIQSHFKPGPSGTNVMDMQIVLLHR